ncbi:MAG: hypothetical protein A2X35_00440 [Elusimicrobia bacterium GWA2_61_42]|nr:MAG: hypothetical protein A2X35_00440 [Elusimicrobia bacterium GWA2_61_42]OGR79195.1 MAG: hypothetical protein A2X38_06555 [Elusimicrobia bacterium GWC2_61_25]
MIGAAAKNFLVAAAMLLAPRAYAQFQATTPLPQALLSHTAVTLNGRIYVAGGISDAGSVTGGSGYINNIYYCADMNPDGTLGAWKAASPMPEFLGLGMHAAASYNGRLYVLGGTNLLGPRNVAYFSAVNADGTLTGWQPTTPMPQKVAAHAAAIYGGRLYVTGGSVRNTGATALTYSAPINADGALGEWRYETPLPSTLFGHKSFTRAGKLFVLGGSAAPRMYGEEGLPAGAISSMVYGAAINADGTLGAWAAQPAMPAQLALFALVDTEKSVYLLGGFDGGVVNSVYFSPISADGALGDWQALQALPQNLLSLAAVATPDYLYSLGGGLAYIETPVNSIYFAKLKAEPRAFVKLNPSSINKGANGKWVTVIIGLPEADAAAVVPASVKISAINGQAIAPILPDPKWTASLHSGDSADFSGMAGVSYLMLKFGRQEVAQVIPEGEFSVKVEGLLADGRAFSGESMNRGLSSKKLFSALMEARAGERKGAGGVKVNIPKGAFKGNADLLLTAAPEDTDAVAAPEKEKRSKGMKTRGLAAASESFEFGPHGEAFAKPVTISLPYNAAGLPAGADENNLKVAYWNQAAGEWEVLPSVVSKADKLVSADVAHFSVYQVVSEAVPTAAPQAFALGEVYVFPNPALAGARPKLHIAASAGDKAAVKVYSVSGRLVYETNYAGAPAPVAGAQAYELELAGEFTSGIYYYLAEVSSGAAKLKKSGKFAVVR